MYKEYNICPLNHTSILCKSNANNNRRISCFVLAIYRQYISETSHGLANVKMINQWDISTMCMISRRDIVLARLPCNDISQSKTIYCHDISLQWKCLWYEKWHPQWCCHSNSFGSSLFLSKKQIPHLQLLKWDKGCYLEQTQFPYCLHSHQ